MNIDRATAIQASQGRAAGRTEGSQQRVVRCCATCAEWLPNKMECKHVPNEAAPPEASCGGWVRRREPNRPWDMWANEKAPNVPMSEPPTKNL
jgi:hypothetical protein